MTKPLNKKIKDILFTSQKTLVVSHKNPDGDTIGAALSLVWSLPNGLANCDLYCQDEIPAYLKFLPGVEHFKSSPKELATDYTAAVLVDCASLDYSSLPEVRNFLTAEAPIINFDHHLTNPRYGQINLVEEQASSCCELLYNFYSDAQIFINQSTAINLLTGIITDTGNLTYTNTTRHTFEAVSKLLASGAKLPLIISAIAKDKNQETFKVWGLALSRLTKNPNSGLIYTVITENDFSGEVDSRVVDGLANFLNSLGEGEAVLVLREFGGKIKGSLRTTKDSINVAKLAKLLGGGGHKKAAGFTLNGKLIRESNGWRVE